MEATRDQWQAQGILQQEPRSEAWLRMLQGSGRTSRRAASWRSWSAAARAVLVPRQRRADRLYPARPRQSAAFSTRFLAIWLDPRTTYPELRQQLIGGTP